MTNKKSESIHELLRVETAVLKADVARLKQDVTAILENHLPTIQKDLSKVKSTVAMWGGAIIVFGILAPYILQKIFSSP